MGDWAPLQPHEIVRLLPQSLFVFSDADSIPLIRFNDRELTSNALRGTLPSSICNLTSLTSLFVSSFNTVKSSLTDYFGPLLTRRDSAVICVVSCRKLSANFFSGTIPSCIGNLKNLEIL